MWEMPWEEAVKKDTFPEAVKVNPTKRYSEQFRFLKK
jgi:hypothetical protein